MAGTSRSGARKTPIAIKIANGTFRPDRDGPIAGAAQATGMPLKPKGLPKHASELWDRIVPGLAEAGVAKAIDTPMLTGLVELWNLYRMSHDLAVKDPDNKDLRGNVVAYWGRWESVAGRFGMNPSDRARMQIPTTPTKVATRDRSPKKRG